MTATGRVSSAQKEEIRSRVPLEEILPEYNVHLIPSGRKFKALCPFHQEKTPSFWVDAEKQLYYCYGCQVGGDLFRFVEQMDRVSWSEAVQILARRAGVVLELDSAAGGRSEVLDLYDALEHAASTFHEILIRDPRGAAAREYLTRRGIREEMWERFRLGVSLPAWDALLRQATAKGFSPEVLERAGLVRQRDARGRAASSCYDMFRGRLMFPITDPQNRVIGFGARTLGEDLPKYLNTPGTPLFDKSQVLYGLSQARAGIRRTNEIIIVEGYTDVIAAHQAGLDNVVAGLGTAFTRDNARQLHRLASRVLIVFDGDAAGQEATERSLDILVGEDLDVLVFQVSGGEDPCEAVLALGGEAFRRRIDEGAVGIFEFKWRRTLGEVSGAASRRGAVAHARAVDEFLRLVARVKNVVTRRLILREYAERSGVAESELEARLRVVSGSTAAATARSARERSDAQAGAAPVRERPLGELAEIVLECLLALPSQAASIWQQVPKGLFQGPAGEALAVVIERQLAEGAFSSVRLAREIDEPSAHSVVAKVLSRLDMEAGDPAVDHALLWQNCQRDVRRWQIAGRIGELERLAREAREEADAARFRSYRQERTRLLKELKR